MRWGNKTKTEYKDSKSLLDAKLAIAAKLIKQGKKVVIYNGAGLSVAAGINDLASKNKQKEKVNRLDLQPTKAHHALVAMYQKKFIRHWVTQNHDGLAQKAGMPWADINEIHGGWFDNIKNRVKMMDDKLCPKKL